MICSRCFCARPVKDNKKILDFSVVLGNNVARTAPLEAVQNLNNAIKGYKNGN